MNVLWNTGMVGAPVFYDDNDNTGIGADISWTATVIGSIGNQHVILQYINTSGDTPTVYFRIDRPLV